MSALGRCLGSIVRDRVVEIFDLAAVEFLSPETCLQVALEDARELYPDAEDIEST